MKKTIITLFLMGSVLSANAYSDDRDLAVIAGLVGLALIVGDGHTSLGVHYNNGYYNYRGARYNNRAAYLRAVSRYEAQRNYQYNRYYSSSNSYRHYNYSRYNNFNYQDSRSNHRSYYSDRYDSNRYNNDRSRDRSSDRNNRNNGDRDDNRNNDRSESRRSR